MDNLFVSYEWFRKDGKRGYGHTVIQMRRPLTGVEDFDKIVDLILSDHPVGADGLVLLCWKWLDE